MSERLSQCQTVHHSVRRSITVSERLSQCQADFLSVRRFLRASEGIFQCQTIPPSVRQPLTVSDGLSRRWALSLTAVVTSCRLSAVPDSSAEPAAGGRWSATAGGRWSATPASCRPAAAAACRPELPAGPAGWGSCSSAWRPAYHLQCEKVRSAQVISGQVRLGRISASQLSY